MYSVHETHFWYKQVTFLITFLSQFKPIVIWLAGVLVSNQKKQSIESSKIVLDLKSSLLVDSND